MDERRVYSQLYDIAEANLQKAGMEMQFTKESFLHSVTRELKYIDMFEFVGDDNDTFIQSLYIAFLLRTPERETRERWKNVKNLTKKQLQNKIFTSIISSEEFLEKGTIVCNNLYSSPNFRIQVLTKNNNYVDKLYGYYRKMPTLVRKVIKKVLIK